MTDSVPGPAYKCPNCGRHVSVWLTDHTRYTCPGCQSIYNVLVDEKTNEGAFFDLTAPPAVEPLWLPKGSVRGLMALMLTAACCARVYFGRDVPAALSSLLLAAVGFYFGFRTKAAMLSDRVYDPRAKREQPLFLPAGAIRLVLVIAFLWMGVALALRRELLANLEYLEFFFVLAGLIAGHLFSKLHGGKLHPAITHVKGMLGLLAAAALMAIFVTGRDALLGPATITLLCVAVSFYFGSRS